MYNQINMVKNQIKRRGRKVILPSITFEDLEAALSNESRSHVRKRLIALRAVLKGASEVEAAKLIQAKPETVGHWLRTARRHGLESLIKRSEGRKSRLIVPASEQADLLASVRSALSGTPDSSERLRLLAVARVLEGDKPTQIANEMGVTTKSVRGWLKKLREDGVVGLKDRVAVRKRCIDADCTALRDLAAEEKNSQAKRALLAIAFLAEGDTVHAAGVKVCAEGETVQRWLNTFNGGGIEALRRPVKLGRKTRLSRDQKAELAAIIVGYPGVSNESLRRSVRQRFAADYTSAGLMRLIKADLGFVRDNGRFVSADRAHVGAPAPAS